MAELIRKVPPPRNTGVVAFAPTNVIVSPVENVAVELSPALMLNAAPDAAESVIFTFVFNARLPFEPVLMIATWLVEL
jgi:hypothetical protein